MIIQINSIHFLLIKIVDKGQQVKKPGEFQPRTGHTGPEVS
jgi:hypothetical protein